MGQQIGYSQDRQYLFYLYVLNILFRNFRLQMMYFVLFLRINFDVLHIVQTADEHDTNYTFLENKHYPTISGLFYFGK